MILLKESYLKLYLIFISVVFFQGFLGVLEFTPETIFNKFQPSSFHNLIQVKSILFVCAEVSNSVLKFFIVSFVVLVVFDVIFLVNFLLFQVVGANLETLLLSIASQNQSIISLAVFQAFLITFVLVHKIFAVVHISFGDIVGSQATVHNDNQEANQYHIHQVQIKDINQLGVHSLRLLQAIAAFKLTQAKSSNFSSISFLKAVLFLRV